ncbi:helix-turn-helix domain-containing protein [Fusobacterium varium]
MIGLGDRLAELRKDSGYTQDFIANFLNVTRSSVSAYELGVNEPSIDSLVLLANLYRVSLDYLCCRTREKVNLNLESNVNKEFLLDIQILLKDYTVMKK